MTDQINVPDYDSTYTDQLIEDSRLLRAHSVRLRQEIRQTHEETLAIVRALRQSGSAAETALDEPE